MREENSLERRAKVAEGLKDMTYDHYENSQFMWFPPPQISFESVKDTFFPYLC